MTQITHKWFWPLLCLTLFFAGACSDDDTDAGSSEPVPPTLTTENLPENGYNFLYFKQEPRTFTMSVDAPWEITKTDGWFVVTPKQGKAGRNMLITIEGDFNTGDARTGSFTIRANSGSYRYPCITEKTVELTQGAYKGAGFEITGLEQIQNNTVNFPADDPQPVTFSVKASFDWTMTVSDNTWVGITPQKGTAGESVGVTVTPTPNTTDDPKSSDLTLVCFDPENPGNKSEVIIMLRQSRLADMHEVGYVFFGDDFNWITPLWDFTTYNQPYGWPTVDASDFHFYKSDGNTALGEKAAELGYTFNGSTYGRYLGFVKLGKTDENGILTTRALNDIDKDRSATLLVQFDGAYYMTAGGTVDTGTSMSVTVVGGGTIVDDDTTDEGRTLVIPMRSGFAWDRYSFLVKDATAATQIQFCDGVAEKAIKTRLFLDNVEITRADDDMTEAPAAEAVVEPLSAVVDPAAPAEIGPEEQTVAYTIRVNRAWEISTDAEWLTINSVTSGRDKKAQGGKVEADKRSASAPATALLYDVTLQAAQNVGDERSAKVTLKVGGQAVGSIEVKQEKTKVTHTVTVTGLTGNTIPEFEADATQGATFTVRATAAWTIDVPGTDTWYSVAPLSGDADTDVTVTVTPTVNTGSARNGSFTIKAGDAGEPITLSQAATAGILQYTWSFLKEGEALVSKPEHWYKSDDGKARIDAVRAVNPSSSSADMSYTLNSVSDGELGRILMYGYALNDHWLFTVPVRDFKANTTLNLKTMISSSPSGPKFFILEYSADEKATWTAVNTTTIQDKSAADTENREITYTYMCPDTPSNGDVVVNENITIPTEVADGTIYIRLSVCDAMAANKAKNVIPANGGTTRMKTKPDICDAISITEVKL